jgi:hypothetical protein
MNYLDNPLSPVNREALDVIRASVVRRGATYVEMGDGLEATFPPGPAAAVCHRAHDGKWRDVSVSAAGRCVFYRFERHVDGRTA